MSSNSASTNPNASLLNIAHPQETEDRCNMHSQTSSTHSRTHAGLLDHVIMWYNVLEKGRLWKFSISISINMKWLWANIYFCIDILLADRLLWNWGRYMVTPSHRRFIQYVIKCLSLLFRFRCEGGWAQMLCWKEKQDLIPQKQKEKKEAGLHCEMFAQENMIISKFLCCHHSVLMCTAQKPLVIKQKNYSQKTFLFRSLIPERNI